MSLTLMNPANYSSGFFGGISLPEVAVFCISDNGAGGDLYINGLGVADGDVTGALDLESIYTDSGLLFKSLPLLRAFRALFGTPTDAAAELQFQQFLDIKVWSPTTGSDNGFAGVPTFGAKAGLPGGPANVPYLHIFRPGGEGAVAGQWHIELKLRHSIAD